MKCFIHSAKEAVATCKICGKAMCADCSAYSGHTGVCPVCRKQEFMAEVENLLQMFSSKKHRNLIWAAASALLLILSVILSVVSKEASGMIILIPAIIPVVCIFRNKSKMRGFQERIDYLNNEIGKIDAALRHGTAQI